MAELTSGERALFEKLVDEAAVRSVVERYPFAVDWMHWDGLEALFWPDADVDFGMWQGDRAAFIPWVTALEEGLQRRMHMFGSPRIRVDGDHAVAEAPAMIYLRTGNNDHMSAARYLFELARRHGEWRFTKLRWLFHGGQLMPANDQPGAPFADDLSPRHPLFSQ